LRSNWSSGLSLQQGVVSSAVSSRNVGHASQSANEAANGLNREIGLERFYFLYPSYPGGNSLLPNV